MRAQRMSISASKFSAAMWAAKTMAKSRMPAAGVQEIFVNKPAARAKILCHLPQP
jgi:hypothetical protein